MLQNNREVKKGKKQQFTSHEIANNNTAKTMNLKRKMVSKAEMQLGIDGVHILYNVTNGSTTLDRKRIYANPNSYPNPNYNPNPNSNSNPNPYFTLTRKVIYIFIMHKNIALFKSDKKKLKNYKKNLD